MVHCLHARCNQPRPLVFATPRCLGHRRMGPRRGLRSYIYEYQAPHRHNHLHHVLRPCHPPFDSVQARSSFYAKGSTCPYDIHGWLVFLHHCVCLRGVGRPQRTADIVSPYRFLANLIATVCNFFQLDLQNLNMLPAQIFMILDLNAVMSVIGHAGAYIASTVGGTRHPFIYHSSLILSLLDRSLSCSSPLSQFLFSRRGCALVSPFHAHRF